MTNRLPLLPLALLLGAGVVAQDQDAKADVGAMLAKAQARAKVHNKRVLVVLDARAADLAATLKGARAVSRKLLYEFETVPVAAADVSATAGRLHVPVDRGGLAVLAADGTLRTWVAASTFVADGKLDHDALLAMLAPHYCQPVDAEKKLAAALVEAKRTGRNVFVRFDAPW